FHLKLTPAKLALAASLGLPDLRVVLNRLAGLCIEVEHVELPFRDPAQRAVAAHVEVVRPAGSPTARQWLHEPALKLTMAHGPSSSCAGISADFTASMIALSASRSSAAPYSARI